MNGTHVRRGRLPNGIFRSLSKGSLLTKLPWRSERFIFVGALAASLLSLCFAFQALDDLVDDHLGIDPRTSGLLLIACAAFAVALLCLRWFKRGRSLTAVRQSLRENVCALPALRSPATLFLLTFAAILMLALSAHVGELHIVTMIDGGDIVVSLVTAVVLATAASFAVRIIIQIAPDVVRFIASLFAPRTATAATVFSCRAKAAPVHCWAAWSPPLFSRPPPLSL